MLIREHKLEAIESDFQIDLSRGVMTWLMCDQVGRSLNHPTHCHNTAHHCQSQFPQCQPPNWFFLNLHPTQLRHMFSPRRSFFFQISFEILNQINFKIKIVESRSHKTAIHTDQQVYFVNEHCVRLNVH